jgi:acetylornithine deacetylase/succinyl-diaminopimelate desuccinylase-like protein
MTDRAIQYADEHKDQYLQRLVDFLHIPSISALPEHKMDMQRAAQWLQKAFISAGMSRAEIIPTNGNPIVYAEWLGAPGAPTVLIYGHYDVQPIDPLAEWLSPPFEPEIRGENLYGRGTSDDKGQTYIQLAAVDSLIRSEGRLPVNVKFAVEGEEEISSVNLKAFIDDYKDLLKADVAVISDVSILAPDQPSIVYAVRGMCYMEFELVGFSQDLHSGGYGGAVDNPLNAISKILAALKDENGRVTIPGFYDDVLPLSEEERREVAAVPFDEHKFLTQIGASALVCEKGFTPAECLSARPTLDVHGIRGGFIGEGPKTVIPARASAKVSMRLVADQQPEKIAELFKAHIRTLTPPSMRVNFISQGGALPATVDIHHPMMEKAKAAYARSFGKTPLFTREGGTLPVVPMIESVLNAPVIMMGFGLPDDNLHSPNEKFHLPNFYRGIETAIYFLRELKP